MQGDLERVLFDEPTILRRLDEIAAQIFIDYRGRELTVIAVLNGSLMFMADLLRRIPLALKFDCLSVASYHGQAQTSGEVIFKKKRRAREVDANYLGFEIEDEFVVGYGLDYDERYRNLPCIGVLPKELITSSR